MLPGRSPGGQGYEGRAGDNAASDCSCLLHLLWQFTK